MRSNKLAYNVAMLMKALNDAESFLPECADKSEGMEEFYKIHLNVKCSLEELEKALEKIKKGE